MNRVGKVVPPKRQILKDISLSFFPGAKIGLLGLNGAGKSTVLKIMAGIDKEIEGEATPMPGIKIGYLPQEPQLEPGHSVREAVEEGLGEVLSAKTRLDEVYAAYAEPDADFDKLAAEQEKLEKILATADVASLEAQLEVAADALRLPPWEARIENLSGGEKRRVALCRLLLSQARHAAAGRADEPPRRRERGLARAVPPALPRHGGGRHARPLLPRQRRRVDPRARPRPRHPLGGQLQLLAGAEERPPEEGGILGERAPEGAQEGARVGAPERQGADQEEQGAPACASRSSTPTSTRSATRPSEIFIPIGERLGNECIEFENVSKAYGDRLLIDNLSFKVPPGAIVGIIGPNGAGKSTIFRMIMGKEKPDSGEVKIGHTVKLAYVDQSRDALPNDKNAWEAISHGQDILTIGKFEIQSRAYLGRFNFKGQDQQKLVGNLSGGERGRLHLAKTLLDGGNVLLLDEPSNDLDVETLRALEDALSEFAGSVMVISHDRWFLDRICTHILAAEGDSQWFFYQGNYHEYEDNKRERLGEEAAAPHRLRFKALK